MSRRGWLVVGVLVVAAIGLALVLWPASYPKLDPDRVEQLTLFSIDFNGEGKPPPDSGEMLHNYPVLGKVEVTDVEQRRQLIDALNAALAVKGDGAVSCFWPRHVLRVESDGQTTDFVICFQCTNYAAYVNGIPTKHGSGRIGRSVAPVFNKLLEDAGVPVVPAS